MNSSTRHSVAVLGILVGLAASLPAIAAAPPIIAGESRHTSGIALAGEGPYQPAPANEDEARAWDRARRLARSNPTELGYPLP